MTPDERQLLTGLFDRMTGAASQPRDREAEAFIADRVRGQPYAPYLLSQTVIVQEQALRAAAEKIQALEAQVQGGPPQEETSFLGNIGKSIFGGGQAAPQRQQVPPAGGAWGQGRGYGQPQPSQGGPWGGAQGYAPQQDYAPQGGAPQGGGFLRGALGAAAGVAGGVLAADALRGLFGGHNNPFGIASGGGAGAAGGETVVNNYYGDDAGAGGDSQGAGFSQADTDANAQQDFLQEQSDDFTDGGFDPGGSDDSYNV